MPITHPTVKIPGETLRAVQDWNAEHAVSDGYVNTTTAQGVGGVKTFTSIPVLPNASPTLQNHAVRKKYVDDVAMGLSWKAPVLDMDLSSPPPAPNVGDRYRVKPPGGGAWAGMNNELVEWSGAAWISDGAPIAGWAVFSTDDSLGWTYDGSDWIQFTGGLLYDAGDGLDLTGTTFSVDLKANDGLKIDATELTVDYNNTSIGIIANQLAVIDGGVDHNALLNTHNLTTDIDHNSITNTHNLTTDIDHNSITNTHNLTGDINHSTIAGSHNLTTDIDHNTITNGHTLPKRTVMWMDDSTVTVGSALIKFVSTSQRYNFFCYGTTPLNGDTFTNSFFIGTGTATFATLGTTNVNRGKLDYYIDNVLVASAQDWYAAALSYNVEQTFGINITTPGYHTLKVVVNGKHASSSGYYFGLTKFWIKPTND